MIYQNIEEKCRERGISISALEKAVGLGNATIKGWNEANPRVDTLKRVADFFEVTVDELLKPT